MQKNLGKCLFPPIDHRLLTSQAACTIPRKSRNSSNQDSNENHFGVQNGHLHAGSGLPVNDQNKNECLLELERINKEIETVRHEVELEQRRLSCYQTVQGVGSKKATHLFISRSESAGKLDRAFYGCSPCSDVTKTHSRASKYVVDNSKPRTDLEYDPLSNFSADLRSYSSPAKEHSAKKRQDLKMARNAVPFNQKRTVTIQAQLTKLPSPERLDDFGESVLIIDIPPSPDQKIKQLQQHSGSLQDKVEELKDVTTVPVLNNSPQHRVEKDISPTSLVDNNGVDSNCAKNNQCPFSLNDSKECGNIQADGIEVDLPGCLEKLKGDGQNISHLQNAEKEVENYLEPESLSCLIDQQDRKNKNPVVERNDKLLQRELSLCELNQSTEKMKPLQTSNFPPNNSLSFQTPPANSDSQCWQHAKQTHTTTPPILNIVGNQWSSTNVLSVSPHCQKTSKKIPEQMLIKATVNHAPLRSQLKLAAPVSDNSQGWPTQNSSASVDKAASSSTLTGQILQKAESEVVIIDSSSEDELNYSDMEVSDSDPMEECFRIFMEENDDQVNDEQADAPATAMDVEKLESIIRPQGLSGKRRVAHEAKHNEQPLAKSRPQPLVLVPLHGPVGSGFGGQTCITSRIQQIQQKASMLTSSVKGAQALVSSTCQRWPETKSTYPSAQTAENLQNASVQNAFVSYIPLGNAVIGVGSNLQIILSEGAIPLPATSSSSPVTALLTPITQVQTTTVNVKQSYHPPAMTTVQRYRSTTVPLIIPAPARKPLLVSASAHSCPVSSAIPPSATTARPLSTKRKVKQQCETAKEKVPHDIRQRYVNMFTEEFLKTTANVNDAFEKALAEERTVYNRSVNKLKYLSIAVNALKRLKSHGAVAAKNQDEAYIQRLKGNISLNLKKLKRTDNNAFYESLRDYILTKERLIESNYPVKHPENPGSAVLFVDTKKSNADPLKKICCRCGATYSVSQSGKHIRKEECNYHHGKGVKNKVPGGVETRYSCCEAVMGAPGCQVFKLHVHESLNLDGFVSTVPRHPPDSSSPGVYALNCEMCYTVCGLELSRVTLVNSSLQVIYDTFVKPDNEVIDYNTRFSGIDEEDMKGNRTSLRDVQETLLSFISSDTVLIGHSLQTDLCALKLLHGTVVDTSVVFPHRLGPPHKLSLGSLTAEYLRRIIQESVCGHDTAEDASACMELLLWKVKEDGKLKK